ncbi:MAG: hypothetical protein CHACPFDD_01347 [Phycisphaerae bacterium]|nr:hypothetical protein [Phycisphaerae bacterium]
MMIHGNVLKTGRVLFVSKDEIIENAAFVYVPAADGKGAGTTYDVPEAPWPIFCSGHSQTTDGRIFFAGGGGGSESGTTRCNIFDPDVNGGAGDWVALSAFDSTMTLPGGCDDTQPRNDPRYYPTCTTLASGKILVTAGRTTLSNPDCHPADAPRIFNPNAALGSQWTVIFDAPFADVAKPIQWYPFMFQLSNGPIFMGGGRYFGISGDQIGAQSLRLDASGGSWESPSTPLLADFYGGSAVMYRPDLVIKTGHAANSDLGDGKQAQKINAIGTDGWQELPAMDYKRGDHYLLVLPDGKVLAVGGADDEGARVPELFDPDNESAGWVDMATMPRQRVYHSSAVVLPDGRVLIGGGDSDTDDKSAHLYSPPYLFDEDDNNINDVSGVRPQITQAPAAIGYTKTFNVYSDQVSSITRVTLVRLGSSTHSFDMNTRFLELSFTVPSTGTPRLKVTAPAHGFMAPPGYYMLFILKPTPAQDNRPNVWYPSRGHILKLEMQLL